MTTAPIQSTFQSLRSRAKVMAALLCAVSAGATPAAALGATRVEAVATRQVLESGSDIAWGCAEVELDRPAAEVLHVVVDYANYVRFMPSFTRSKVIAKRGSRAVVYMEARVAAGALTLWGQLNLAERVEPGETRVVEASLVQGNMTAFRAEWTIAPIANGDRTRVGFRIYVDPDLPLPATLISRENERAAGKTLGALQQRLAIVEQGARP